MESAARTGVNPAGDAGDTSPIFWLGDVNGNIPPILLRTFGYNTNIGCPPLSLKPISFGYKTPPIRFSQAGGQSAHKGRPPNLELALTPLAARHYTDIFCKFVGDTKKVSSWTT